MDKRRSGEIEEEITRIRQKMDTTLNELEHRFSRDDLVERILASDFGEYGSILGRLLRENPIPSAIAAFGVGWLALVGSGYFAESRLRRQTVSSRRKEAKISRSDQILNFLRGFQEANENWKYSRRRPRSRGRFMARSSERPERIREGFEYLLERQPHFLLLMGLALGGITGSLFPPSRGMTREGREESRGRTSERATAYAAAPAAYDSTPSAEEEAQYRVH